MGGKESTLKVYIIDFDNDQEQSWCSSQLYCKNCVTEVENVNTEVKRTSPIPRGDLQNMIKEQKALKASSNNPSGLQHSGLPSQGHMNYNIFQSDEKKMEFKSALKQEDRLQKLREEVLSSAFLEKGEVLIINALGLENDRSFRKAQDGFTYFGCKKSIKRIRKSNQSTSTANQKLGSSQKQRDKLQAQMGATGASVEEIDDPKGQSYEKEIVNDFVIPTKSEEEKEKHRGRQFQIYYDTESKKYKIKDLGIGYGAFVKLTKPLILRDNFLLNMGESYIVANLLKPQDDLIGIVGVKKMPQRLRLKIFSVVKADQPDVFCCQNEDQEIVIGRTPNCDIRIEDKLLSKAQATIKFDGAHWVLQDGYEGRESTNGTWLYLNEDCEVEDGMVFKSNQTFFEATLLSKQLK